MNPLGVVIALLPLGLIAWWLSRGSFVQDAGAAAMPEFVDTNAGASSSSWSPLPPWLTSSDPLGEAPAPDAIATTNGGIVLDQGTVSTWTTPPAGAPYASAFAAAESKYGLPAGLLSSQAYQESRYNPNAYNSSSGAIGLMQFLPSTANDYGIDPKDPLQSIDGAGRYMRDLYQRFGSWSLALAAYNWGMGNVQRKGIAAAPTETKNYFAQILGRLGLNA